MDCWLFPKRCESEKVIPLSRKRYYASILDVSFASSPIDVRGKDHLKI